jgi:hypothetical protein
MIRLKVAYASHLWVRWALACICQIVWIFLSSRLQENNPEVMTALVHKLGLSSTLAFHDVYSLDDPSLLAFVPRPVHALLLVFPVSKTYETQRAAEDSSLPEYSGSGPNEEVLWFRQTIGNACGMMGLLHSACNGGAKEKIGMSRPRVGLDLHERLLMCWLSARDTSRDLDHRRPSSRT